MNGKNKGALQNMDVNQDDVVDPAEEAAFLAEMAKANGEDAQAPVAVAEQPAEVVEPVPEETVAERKEIIEGYTAEELKEALDQLPKLQKALDTTNGTYGKQLADQQRIIEELKQSRANIGGGLTKEKLTRLSVDFPEIAEMLAADLSEYAGQGATLDPAQVEQLVTPRLQALEEQFAQKEQAREIKALTKAHPDWREVAAIDQDANGQAYWRNPKFAEYVAKLPQEEQARIVNEWDADFIADKLSEFKASIKPKPVSNKTIQNAVMPRGAGGRFVPNADIDEEEAAFRAEMARR